MGKHFTLILIVLCLVFTLAFGEVINGDRTFLGFMDAGGAVSLEIPNSATPTTDAAGEIALDTTIVDHQPLLQYFDGGENMTAIAIDTAELPALDNEIVKYDAATDKFVLEADAGGASELTHFIPLICDTPDTVTNPGESFVQGVNLDPIQTALWHLADDGATDVDARVFCHIRVPENLGATPAAAIVLDMASSNTTASETVRLQISFANIGNTETHDATLTAEAAVTTGSWPTVAFERFDFTEVLSAQPTAGDYMAVDIFRDVDDAGDIMDLDVLIFDAFLRIDLTL